MNRDGVYEPVNLGNPGEFTMKELAEEVARICGVAISIKYKQLPDDDPKRRHPDITRAQQLLDWNPTIPLREGLNKTVAYFSRRIGSVSKRTNATSSFKGS
jgi:UDP-glucuronate decarboxylase